MGNYGGIAAAWDPHIKEIYSSGLYIPKAAGALMGIKTGQMLAMGGQYRFLSSTYSTQKALLTEAAEAMSALKAGTKAVGWVGVGITAVMDVKGNIEYFKNGPNSRL